MLTDSASNATSIDMRKFSLAEAFGALNAQDENSVVHISDSGTHIGHLPGEISKFNCLKTIVLNQNGLQTVPTSVWSLA